MIICPNCKKKITTIPNKQLTISCTCKATLRTNSHWLESFTKKSTYKDKPISLVYIFGGVKYNYVDDQEFVSQHEFVILDNDNQQMIHLDFHPDWDKLPRPDFEKKLKTYLIFS